MAIRDALLALLLTGPAYGFQLHTGVHSRTGGRRVVNVGQSYATLDRLTKQNMIESAGSTDDGLPLHQLTADGRQAAHAWLMGADAAGAGAWDETVDRVLIAVSLPGVEARDIVADELKRWQARAAGTDHSFDATIEAAQSRPLEALAAAADTARARAMVDWLRHVSTIGREELDSFAFAPPSERPKRGRRPSATNRSGEDARPAGVAAPAVSV